MFEMMVDLETLDVQNGAVVLSIGAVTWETLVDGAGDLDYEIVDRFYRVLAIDEQIKAGRSVSEHTLLWWMQQDPTARAEAFSAVRCPVKQAMEELIAFAERHVDVSTDTPVQITKFWAGPATFDFPIWDDLAFTFEGRVPWRYNQKYDLRTVVSEASYSAKDHKLMHPLVGIAHTPVYDCEWQIDLLTAARQRIARRMY